MLTGALAFSSKHQRRLIRSNKRVELTLQIAHHQANLFEPRGVLRLEYLLNGLPTPVTAHRSAVIKIELFEINVVQRVLL
jgi:hypothetical protein